MREKSKPEILVDFDEVMSRVADRELPEWDRLEKRGLLEWIGGDVQFSLA